MHYKTALLCMLLCLASFNLAGCGLFNGKPKSAFKKDTPELAVDKARKIASSVKGDDSNFTVNPVAINEENTDKTPTPLSKTLFDKTTLSTEERFARLEDQVQNISNTIDRMAPSITKLMGVESELDSLTFQLEDLIEKGKLGKFEQAAPPPTEQKETAAKPTNKPNNIKTVSHSGHMVKHLRLGDHPDKSRIVFETISKADYQATLDQEEGILTVIFPSASLNPNISQRLKKLAHHAKVVTSIIINTNDDGTAVIFDLSKNDVRLKEFRIAPNKTSNNYRIVLDLF